ncbi:MULTISPECIES: universal stress protein [unclassified Streptomyces]|uniref:universal stress protein n=1 Tax=unclassified Streptomyces TaxID=2593676 RepID=UPI003D72BE9E
MTQRTDSNGIVVGVDGSDASRAALRWAARQAHVLGTRVLAVHAWEPAPLHAAPYAPVAGRPTRAQQRERAAALLADSVREVFGPRVDPAVHAVLAEGPPARVLLRHTDGALLLALGHSARGREDLPAVGPVSRECLRHAAVPVVTVPAPDPDRAEPDLRIVQAPPARLPSGAGVA